jgi:branched-chain amino acid transport system permease protein
MSTGAAKVWLVHLALLAVLAAAPVVLSDYHATNLARVMVLAVLAMGYNLAFGYTGLLSLGHALFFAAGMYGTGLALHMAEWPVAPALLLGPLAGAAVAAAVGVLALRTAGVAFMIVTLMFAQAGYLTILYFGALTGGDEGFVIGLAERTLAGVDLAAQQPRYAIAFALFASGLILSLLLVRGRAGRLMVAMRENEERSRMLGHDPFRVKLGALVLSGLYAGTAGSAYGVLFGYVGASFAATQYSILPLLWVLIGGAGTVLGPFLGVLVMFHLIDWASSVTTASVGLVGVALLGVVLFAPKGILGALRERWFRWLP